MENHQADRLNFTFKGFLVAAIILWVLAEILLCITPPIARDALIHHLAIPKLWLKHGGFYEMPWATFSYYPMNMDLLYLIPLYFKNDILPGFIHLVFGLATAWLIYLYLNRKIGQVAGLLGVLVFISTPIVVRLSTTAYADLGLVFFTTASILAFVVWRNSEYQGNKWFYLSAISMGLALGTKYNALIVWFFLNLALVFCYARDTGRQWQAVRCGTIFFLIAWLIFSPWLIKNAALTGNPFYPLFNGFFNTGLHKTLSDGETLSVVAGGYQSGMFKMREMMYGESFWETLLIPIRFFFQGQDHSDRYFDGVLNPILIVMVPFAFIGKSFQRDKRFFLLFSIFLIILTFFLDFLRVRYLLPVLPFLTVLAVMGLLNIFTWAKQKAQPVRNICWACLLCFFIVMMSKNALYLSGHFQYIQPMSYILQKETRDEFIKRHNRSYPAIQYINKTLPENARIRLVLLAGRGYYLDRSYVDDPSFGMDVIRKMAETAGRERDFKAYLASLRCTHFLIRMDLMNQFLQNNFPPDDTARFYLRMRESMDVMFNGNGYAVFRLHPV